MAEERAYLYRNAGTKASPVWERWYPRTMVDAVEMGDEDGTTLAEYLKNIGTGFSDIYVTPEQFGAKGNGIDDDSPALLKALETSRPVMLKQDLYLKSRILVIDKNVFLEEHWILRITVIFLLFMPVRFRKEKTETAVSSVKRIHFMTPITEDMFLIMAGNQSHRKKHIQIIRSPNSMSIVLF